MQYVESDEQCKQTVLKLCIVCMYRLEKAEGEESPAMLTGFVAAKTHTHPAVTTNHQQDKKERTQQLPMSPFLLKLLSSCLSFPSLHSLHELRHHFSPQASNILLFSDSITSYSLLSLHNFSTSLLFPELCRFALSLSASPPLRNSFSPYIPTPPPSPPPPPTRPPQQGNLPAPERQTN